MYIKQDRSQFESKFFFLIFFKLMKNVLKFVHKQIVVYPYFRVRTKLEEKTNDFK